MNSGSCSQVSSSCYSTCAQQPPPPPPTPGVLRSICPPCQSWGGAFANFALPGRGGRAFANPGAIPELLTRGILSEYNYTEGFTGKKADWLICQGQE